MKVVTGRQLQRAGRYTSAWRAELDRLILAAHQEGGSLRDIAQLAGVSHETVRSVVARAQPVHSSRSVAADK